MTRPLKDNLFTRQYFGSQFGRLVENLDKLSQKTELPETVTKEISSTRDPYSLVICDDKQAKTFPIICREAIKKRLKEVGNEDTQIALARKSAIVMMNIIISLFNFVAQGKFDKETNLSIFKTTADTCNKMISFVNRSIK